MAMSTPSFAPPWGALVWVDNTHIYAELPNKNGPPMVLKHPNTAAGFAKILESCNVRFKAAVPKGGYYQLPAPPPAQRIPEGVTKANVGTEASRAEALKVLKKLGML